MTLCQTISFTKAAAEEESRPRSSIIVFPPAVRVEKRIICHADDVQNSLDLKTY